ncbi:AAA family ATPase [archaeon]|jgi:DNA repair protein SbcC/Rad50|nr:AAA family ATPase [archaeon]
MKLKYIKLKNIRSYLNQIIDFKDGSTLLSGNIGTGKTTLLLALDFAFFGLRKSDLSGSALLRNGENEGYVEINFELDGKDIIIRRNLKRTSKSITQGSGMFIIDDKIEELTPIELRQKVIDLFKYPQEFLTKSKSLIYNYTVYTPQEEMKSILLAKSDERLNILRKTFGIDKYKRIVENSKLLISNLNSSKKEFEIISSNLNILLDENEIKTKRLVEIDSSLIDIKLKLIGFEKKINQKKLELSGLAEQNKRKIEIQNKINLLNVKLNELITQRSRNNSETSDLNSEIESIRLNIGSEVVGEVSVILTDIASYESDLNKLEIQNKEILKKSGELQYILSESDKLVNGIISLDSCPLCKQTVSEDHKNHISVNESEKLSSIKLKLSDNDCIEKENLEKISNFKLKISELIKDKNLIELKLIKKKNLDSKFIRLNNLIKIQSDLKRDIGQINSQKICLSEEFEGIYFSQEEFNSLSEEILELSFDERNLNAISAANEKEVSLLKERIDSLKIDIEKKKIFKQKIVKISEILTFLEKEFVPLMQLTEKQIMKKIHGDFNSLFSEWFKVLVDDEDIEISLDYDFTPIIRQNGYDIEYGFLSGGERTAAALAYRLALNQIINTVLSEINTKDLLILDEPTDGFSSEQVDKLRSILEELDIKQVIIVSHDPKIESFVDNVIKFEKKDGVSEVI